MCQLRLIWIDFGAWKSFVQSLVTRVGQVVRWGKNKKQVPTDLMGCHVYSIHRRDPTTAQRGSFCLRCFHSEPLHSSLLNLDVLRYRNTPILTQSLVRTPDQHSRTRASTPTGRQSTAFSLHTRLDYRDTPPSPA